VVTSGFVRPVRLFLFAEAVGFMLAALPHYGILGGEYEAQPTAIIVHGAIATELLLGFGLTWIRREWTQTIGVVAQAVALLATLVGVLTIAVGIGPRTVPEVGFHVGVLLVLAWGLVVANAPGRTPAPPRRDWAA
jgi:hypothetical protein